MVESTLGGVMSASHSFGEIGVPADCQANVLTEKLQTALART